MRRLLVVPPVVLCLLAGCSYYDSSLLEPAGGAGKGGSAGTGPDASGDAGDAGDAGGTGGGAGQDGGSDATDDGATPPDGGCVSAQPPDPPAVADAGGEISFVVATSMIDFGDLPGSDPETIGFDLDMRCTCPEANGCMREAWATADACDGPGGRDNMTGRFMKEVSTLFAGLGSEAWTEGMQQGTWSLLLRVRDYNGLPDDDRVRLDWYIPAEFYRLQDGGTEPPKWDGSDAWPIRKNSLETPPAGEPWDIDKTVYYDDRAYVTDGVLVASVSEATIEVTVDYHLTIVGAFMVADVVQEDGRWMLKNGTVAGRWPVENILGQISRIKDPIFDLYMCTDNLAYPQIKQEVCSIIDIYSGVGSPTTPCDAVSAGMRFDTMPAQLGGLVEPGEQTTYCDPAVDPAYDSCDTLGE